MTMTDVFVIIGLVTIGVVFAGWLTWSGIKNAKAQPFGRDRGTIEPSSTIEQRMSNRAGIVDDGGQRPVIVVDIDGTVADNRWRQHLAPDDSRKDEEDAWRAFHEASVKDEPVPHVVALVNTLQGAGHDVVFLTARSEWTRSITDNWLRANVTESYWLLMRPDNDVRKAGKVKVDLLTQLFSTERAMVDAVALVIEDSENNARAFEDMGLPVLMVRGFGEAAVRERTVAEHNQINDRKGVARIERD